LPSAGEEALLNAVGLKEGNLGAVGGFGAEEAGGLGAEEVSGSDKCSSRFAGRSVST
jgi:hypothetical protein